MSGAETQNQGGTPEVTTEESIIDTLRFDPFPSKEPAAPSAKDAGATASPGTAPPRSDQPQAASQPATDGAPGTNAPASAQPQAPQQPQAPSALDTAAQALTAAAERLQAPAPQSGQQPPAKQDDIPAYMYDIPPKLVEALSSENPQDRANALQFLVAGTARAVHTELNKVINDLKASIPQIFQQHIQSHNYREQVRKDFYGKYPMLDNPHLAATVASVSQQVMARLAATGQRPSWSPALADAIANEVFTIFPALRGQVPQPQAQPAPAAPQPQVMFANGSRPAATPTTEADIRETLGF